MANFNILKAFGVGSKKSVKESIVGTKKELEKTVTMVEGVDSQIKKADDVQIAEIKSLRGMFKEIQDKLEKGEADTMNLLDAINNNTFTTTMAGEMTSEFLSLSKKEASFLGAVGFVMDTCQLAIDADKELKSKIVSSKLLNYDSENSKKEVEELKTLSAEEIKILNDAEDLIDHMKKIMAISKTFAEMDDELDDERAVTEFKVKVKKMRTEFSQINVNILKSQEDLKDIEDVLRKVVALITDVDTRLQTSLGYISKRIIEGKQYSPGNPSGR